MLLTFGAVVVGCHSGPRATALQPALTGEAAAIAKAKSDSARYPYTQADIDFMSHMIGHHAQAIQMSSMAPSHGANASIQTLAARIINAQTDEITIMQNWLRARGQPVPDAKPMAMTTNMPMNVPMNVPMAGMTHEMLMPGMLTAEQMARLDSARGGDFDKLFLTGMIQHHKGATQMVKQLFDTYGAAQDELVFKFASDVNVDQTTEIARMERMLAAMTLGISLP